MPPLLLEGKNLGEKHKFFNKLVKETIEKKTIVNFDEHNTEESDIQNLVKIDVASENRNVNYIIGILTCSDMLYITRALKKCDWLICDEQYADIINPTNLNSNLYPRMQTKAIIKLKHLIRLRIQNESRAEQFYNYEQKSSDALKWLPRCSLKFIETNFDKHVKDVNISLLKRLCEKSIKVLELYINGHPYAKKEALEKTLFLLHSDPNKYLDIVETQATHFYPSFGKRATKFLMAKCPQRIINKFGDYSIHIDTPTFVKYLKIENLQSFLINEAINAAKNNSNLYLYFNNAKNWGSFLKAMPKKERFDFIKKIFIDDLNEKNENELNDLEKALDLLRLLQKMTPVYYWYQFITFDLAFSKIKNMIGPETEAHDKNEMFLTLIISAKGNLEHGKCLLKYFQDKHINSSISTKISFLNNFINNFETYHFEKDNWAIFEDIVNSADVYNNTEFSNVIVEAVLVYKILNNDSIPEKTEKLFEFNSLKRYQNKLNTDEKEIIFKYLKDLIWDKIEKVELTGPPDLERYIELFKTMMLLYKDWNKNIIEHPLLLDKIKSLAKIKQEKSWTVDMSSLYNFQKTWRKYMFEQSIILSPTEEVCINSLKHEPNLLELYKRDLKPMFFNETISPKRLFRKVRIYWPQSIGKDWINVYLNGLSQSEGQNATTKGLCNLLPKSELTRILNNHAPKESKIDWDKIKETELGTQRCLAKNMHNARPQPSISTILLYAKGDYLQYALPSLLAIYYNLSSIQCQESLSNILDTPVSLQKHGIRCVFTKLSPDKLRETFNILWKNAKNSTIRTEIFKITFNLLCNEKNELVITDTWKLLEMFIDNLNFQENKTTYQLLFNIDKIPKMVQADYLTKSYKFLKPLIANNQKEYSGTEWDIKKLARYSRKIMTSLPSDFVAEIIKEFINTLFFKEKVARYDMTNLISSYLLCAKDEETQMEKYDDILAPVLKRSFELWNECFCGEYHIRLNLEQLMSDLIKDLNYFTGKQNMVIPVKMFLMIQNELQQSLPFAENYVLIRTWQLATRFVTLLQKNQPVVWDETCLKIAAEFGNICEDLLREDTKSLFPCIYILFTKVLGTFKYIVSDDVQYEICKSLVQDQNFTHGYLAALKLMESLQGNEIKEKVKKIREEICKHPSVEVKMHYYKMYPEDRVSLFTNSKNG